jgi:hypothetical protein
MDVEQRARELLRSEYMLSLSGAGPKQRHLYECAIRAIITALTPPNGYVLVPVEPTSAMQDAVESMKLPHALLRTGVRLADFRERYAAMLAACSEVHP